MTPLRSLLLGAAALCAFAPARLRADDFCKQGAFWGDCPANATPMVADVDGDGKDDLLIYYPGDGGFIDGRLQTPVGKPAWQARLRSGVGIDAVAACVVSLPAPARFAVLVVGANGVVTALPGQSAASLGAPVEVCDIPREMLPGAGATATVADYDGDGLQDVLLRGARRTVLLRHTSAPGEPLHYAVVAHKAPRTPAGRGLLVLTGDMDGDGKPDQIRVSRTTERFSGTDVRVHYNLAGRKPEAVAFGDEDADGLLNGWEDGRIQPGGVDLKALGCTVLRADVVVEVQPQFGQPVAPLQAEWPRVQEVYAKLKCANPDGSTGMSIHAIWLPQGVEADRNLPWWTMGDRYHAAAHRGVTHYMVIYNGGGGQSSEMSDRGSSGSAAFVAVFVHEFGHQLGLDHTGHWPASWCPMYPSLMSYSYSYQLGGNPNAIRYSDGELASLALRETQLDERLPFPPEKVAFISGPPYHYRIKPGPDGKTTLVDWNWNGIFGERRVAADIDYGYSTTAGLRHTIGKTYCAPTLASTGGRLLLFGGRLAPGAPKPESSAGAARPSLAPDQPGKLYVRLWQGSDPVKEGPKWGDEIEVAPAGVLGDPSAATLGNAAWVAYPLAQGIEMRPTAMQGGNPVVGPAQRVPDSAGVQVTLAAFGKQLAVLLWRGPGKNLAVRLARPDHGGLAFGPEEDLGFASEVPPGAAQGGDDKGRATLWVGLMQNVPGGHPLRFQVRRVARDPGRWTEVHREWVSGDKGGERGSSRVVLLHQPAKGLEPDGQLTFMATGLFTPGAPWACHFVCTRIADKGINGGWLTRRFYDEWTCSRSAPGACFFGGDIAFAARWFGNVHGDENDNIFVAFRGSGIELEPMGDFDDVTFMRQRGLQGSMPFTTR